MSQADELLAECVAQPDDLDARLVWADAVGGERGELVALQCANRDALSPAELVAINRRERELLVHAARWSGLGGIAHRVRFRRGFVDAIDIHASTFVEHADRIAAVAPFVTGLTLRRLFADATSQHGRASAQLQRILETEAFARVRALDLIERGTSAVAIQVLADAGALRQLVALGFGDGSNVVNQLLRAGVGHVERLWLRSASLNIGALVPLGLAAHELVALDITAPPPHPQVFARGFPNLVDLTLREPEDGSLRMLVPLADRLVRLVLRTSRHAPLAADELAVLAQFPKLATLDIDGGVLNRGDPHALDVALSALRALHLGQGHADAIAAAARSLGPRLDLLDLRRAPRLVDTPTCAGDLLVDEPVECELLHAGPITRGEWHTQPLRESGPAGAPAWLVLETGHETGHVWEIGELGRLRIGRGAFQPVSILHESVARGHADLTWTGTQWEVDDLQSTNGTIVDGVRADRHVPLTDGVRLDLGAARLRFFTGPGGGARAAAHVGYLRQFDARTGLHLALPEQVGAMIAVQSQWSTEYLKDEIARRLIERARPGVAITWVRSFGAFGVTPGEDAAGLAATCAEPVVLEHGTASIALTVVR